MNENLIQLFYNCTPILISREKALQGLKIHPKKTHVAHS